MTRFNAEFSRLYGVPDQAPSVQSPAFAPVKVMVLELARPADWAVLSSVWRAVQSDLELPAPAVARR